MSTAIRRILPFALAVLAFGCGGSRFNYNGDWSGNRNLQMPGATKEVAYTLGRVTLTIKDNHFELNSGGAPTAGSISFSSGGATLQPDTWMGLPLAQQPPEVQQAHPDLEVKPQPDGSLLFADPMALDHKPVRLTRTQPAS